MDVDLPNGRYVVAVSGGMDSMVLLDLLRQKPGIELVVAHFDHGIRDDSGQDAELVRGVTLGQGLNFELGKGKLGPTASEDQARAARYTFLNRVKHRYQAQYIVTAHHQDDLIETAFINLLRGSGRRGLSAIAANEAVKRPLLVYTKAQIIRYGQAHQLIWREDSTNSDDKYLRNYIRNRILVNLSNRDRQKLLESLTDTKIINQQLDSMLASLSNAINSKGAIDRQRFVMLPHEIAEELVVFWLRSYDMPYDETAIKRLSLAIKTAKAGTRHDVNGEVKLIISQDNAKFGLSII